MTSHDWDDYHTTHVAGKTTAEVYTARTIAPELDPKGVKMRESRDSDMSPESTAIIAGLDVTGSMASVLDAAANNLGVMVEELYSRLPVTNPHLMFMGIGDAEAGDRCPLQVSQFEVDVKIAQQLQNIYFEQNGGGNSFEGYIMAWYFAAMHTGIDCFEKRGKKGILFTMGDEEITPRLRAVDVERVLGYKPERDFTALEVFEMVSKMYHVFHLVIEEGSHCRYDHDATVNSWRQVLGQHALLVSDVTKIAEVMVSTMQVVSGEDKDKVAASWDGSTSVVVSKAISGLSKIDETASSSGVVEL